MDTETDTERLARAIAEVGISPRVLEVLEVLEMIERGEVTRREAVELLRLH